MNVTKNEIPKDETGTLQQLEGHQENESNDEPVYHVIESVNKYAFTNGRKINKVRLVIKRFTISDKQYMTFRIHVMNQAGTAPVEIMKAGKRAYTTIREVSNTEPEFATVLKKCKRNVKKMLTYKEAKSLDQLISKYSIK